MEPERQLLLRFGFSCADIDRGQALLDNRHHFLACSRLNRATHRENGSTPVNNVGRGLKYLIAAFQNPPVLKLSDFFLHLSSLSGYIWSSSKKTFSLASALASAANPGVVEAIRQRFDERNDACASLAKAAVEVISEREGRMQAEKALAKIEADYNAQVKIMSKGLSIRSWYC